ncbi:putative ww domain-binding protein 2 [Aphelenchoides bicaudatus]|nr:putative ww domain-binding protein 2 [Aphelenchoides bicaudatus]
MSANNSHTPDGNGILLYAGETVIIYAKQVCLSFKTEPEPFFKGKHTGNLYLTTHRIIFLATENTTLKSLAMPFVCINNVDLEQPIFGANYLQGNLAAQPGGNFEGEVVWRLTFNKGGCIDFGRALRQAVNLVQARRPANAPPAYVPPAGSFYAAPPVYSEAPIQNQMNNGFQAPTSVFTDRPEQGTLFVFDQPPPYAGIADPSQHQPIYPNLNNQGQMPPYPQQNQIPPYPSGSNMASAPPLPSYNDLDKKHN